ncbi:hypothetical protein ABT160_45845 [Streptomyces sp. NPDC001941]|uniref:hypothetical protein n=1 Tax=Streptomyces sp. NPDC001941 TaxID=3154659 RepID=UPI003325A735
MTGPVLAALITAAVALVVSIVSTRTAIHVSRASRKAVMDAARRTDQRDAYAGLIKAVSEYRRKTFQLVQLAAEIDSRQASILAGEQPRLSSEEAFERRKKIEEAEDYLPVAEAAAIVELVGPDSLVDAAKDLTAHTYMLSMALSFAGYLLIEEDGTQSTPDAARPWNAYRQIDDAIQEFVKIARQHLESAYR